MANVLTGSQTQTDRIERAWQRVMFNQFHDILAGCSIKPAYDDAYSAFGCAKEVALEVGTFAAERISWRVNTTKFFENGVPEQRAVQFDGLSVIKNSGIVVSMDHGVRPANGDTDISHPNYKKPIGERLADLALCRLYGIGDESGCTSRASGALSFPNSLPCTLYAGI